MSAPTPREVLDQLAERRGIPEPVGDAEPFTKPKWADLFGIAPDYCGGQDVNEWLDEQRGDA